MTLELGIHKKYNRISQVGKKLFLYQDSIHKFLLHNHLKQHSNQILKVGGLCIISKSVLRSKSSKTYLQVVMMSDGHSYAYEVATAPE